MIRRDRYEAIIREYYENELEKDHCPVKILTGMYRSGKSTALKRIQQFLRMEGVALSDIQYIDFDAVRHTDISNGGTLIHIARNLSRGSRKMYLLLDEVGNLPDWEKAVGTIAENFSCCIYITGARSSIFRGYEDPNELLDGNFVEIPVYPYSFTEFFRAVSENTLINDPLADIETADYRESCLKDYMIYGNMPGIHRMVKEQDTVFSYLLDVFQAGILQDVVKLRKIRNVDHVWMVLNCIGSYMGQPLSAKVIAEILKEDGRQVGKDTVYTILDSLLEAQMIQKIPRFDIKTGKTLEGQEQYYFTDWGMYHSLQGINRKRQDELVKNILCINLLHEGWKLYRLGNHQCSIDFMAVREEEYQFYIVGDHPDQEKEKQIRKQIMKIDKEAEPIYVTISNLMSFLA